MGRAPYGYQRVYDSSTGELARQEPDERAPAVAQYFTDLSAGVPVAEAARTLRVTRQVGQVIARNCAYAGLRRGPAAALPSPAASPPILRPRTPGTGCRKSSTGTAALAVIRVRTGPCWPTWPPAAYCGEPVVTHKARDRYRCRKGCCTHRTIDEADLHVEFRLADLLAQEGAMEQFIRSDDTAAVAARSEAARLRQRLDEARTGYAAGQIGFEALARVEQDLVPAVEAAEETARKAAIPAALHPLAGMDRWQDIWLIIQAMPVGGLREVIRVLCDVKLYPGRRLEVVLRELPG